MAAPMNFRSETGSLFLLRCDEVEFYNSIRDAVQQLGRRVTRCLATD